MTDGMVTAENLPWRDLLFSFRGRVSRRIFVTRCMFAYICTGALITLALFIVIQGIEASRGGAPFGPWITVAAALFTVAFFALLIWMNLATTAKRLHDRGRSGWLTLLLLVPLVNFWISLETFFLGGKTEANKFGPPSSAGAEKLIFVICLGIVAIVLESYFVPIVARSFVIQTFDIPSGAQEPTLLVGDYFFVSKSSYGYSRYSFPMGVIPISGRWFASPPKYGDMLVFKFPGDNTTDYIKRLVGLPGDRIQMRDGVLYINDKAVPKIRVADYVEDLGGMPHHVPQYRETLPNGASYNVLDRDPQGDLDNTQVFVVPEGHYFMLGDNRDNSADSRVNVGYVPFENFVGKAEFLFFSTNGKARLWEIWKWSTAIRYDRIGHVIY
ncbi:MAG TPA: signal peptidase I [Micropepsaceae bacterium]|nr:signal peptidase I [Micropepsaceae bacterium]